MKKPILPARMILSKIPLHKKSVYDLTPENTAWVADLLTELNEEIDADDMKDRHPSIAIELGIQKKDDSEFNEHVIIDAHIDAHYFTPCIRCLEPSAETLHLNFSGCIISRDLEDNPRFKDIDTVMCGTEEKELYFYDDSDIEIAEFVHEQLFLHKNPMPLHDPDCKGLCQTCGANLNHGDCGHKVP